MQRSQTASQSLRAFPQFLTVDAGAGGGDRTGYSTYHAGILKVTYRMASSLTFQGSYGFSKIITNADSFSDSGGSLDAGNTRLERSVGAFDQTHTVKLSTVYEFPFGSGKRWIPAGGVSNAIVGGGRLSGIQIYNSSFPIGVTANGTLPIFNLANRPTVTTHD